jgi:hypothetical protein
MDKGDSESGGRFEAVISVAAPLLDLVLAVGDRVSKLLEPEDYEYYPVRDEDPQESGDSPRSSR